MTDAEIFAISFQLTIAWMTGKLLAYLIIKIWNR